MDIDLEKIEVAGNGSDEAARFYPEQFPGTNGETNLAEHTTAQRLLQSLPVTTQTHEKVSVGRRIKKELNEKVFWKVRLWMVVVAIFLIILAVIFISLALCSVIHEDVDEKYDQSSFKVPRSFNGSFLLPNRNVTSELYSPSSNRSQMLAAELREKLSDLYRASPALGRYFSDAEIYPFRNGSATAHFRLKFLMPAEHGQLEKFTLSREVVYNVFRQFLYDHETDEQGLTYIDPTSLSMV
ncbi:TPA-induced transmembrane protein homolog isoform X2 [Lampris incognitus]|uniref:TPA-induced transmembrane protein homolog isoform X2 n=1 Tax=Lampris incognitus TaxID=2546036 RepID=UPI0024B628ED|nr:TPA-induced transmembrane protein homolog isoform X2 [Lampris incognitus]